MPMRSGVEREGTSRANLESGFGIDEKRVIRGYAKEAGSFPRSLG